MQSRTGTACGDISCDTLTTKSSSKKKASSHDARAAECSGATVKPPEEVQGAIRKDHRDMRREQYQARRVKFKIRRVIETVRDFKYLGRITSDDDDDHQQ
jgi:hypothetical protein